MQPPITPPPATTPGQFIVALYSSPDRPPQFWQNATLSEAIAAANSWLAFAAETSLPCMATIRNRRTGVLMHRAATDLYEARYSFHEPAIELPGVPS